MAMLLLTLVCESVLSKVDVPDEVRSNDIRSWLAILISPLAMVAGSVLSAVGIWEFRVWYAKW